MFGDKNNEKQENALISQIKYEYESKLAEQKDRIFSLVEQNKELQSLLESYTKKNSEISEALIKAIETSKEIEQVAAINYESEIADLKIFRAKWVKYFDMVKNKYPINEEIQAIESFNKELSAVLDSELSPKEQISEFRTLMDSNASNIENLSPNSYESIISTDEEIELLSRKVMEELKESGMDESKTESAPEIELDTFDIDIPIIDSEVHTNELDTEEFKQIISDEVIQMDDVLEEQREREIFQEELGKEVANMDGIISDDDDDDDRLDFTKMLNDEYISQLENDMANKQKIVSENSEVKFSEINKIEPVEAIIEQNFENSDENKEEEKVAGVAVENFDNQDLAAEQNLELLQEEILKTQDEIEVDNSFEEAEKAFEPVIEKFDNQDLTAEQNLELLQEEILKTQDGIEVDNSFEEAEKAFEPVIENFDNQDLVAEQNLELLQEEILKTQDRTEIGNFNVSDEELMEKVEEAESTLNFTEEQDVSFFDNWNNADFSSEVSKFADKDEITTLQTLFAGYSNLDSQTADKSSGFDIIKENSTVEKIDSGESGIFDRVSEIARDKKEEEFQPFISTDGEGGLFNPIEKINNVMKAESEGEEEKIDFDEDPETDLLTLCKEFDLAD